MWRILSGRGCVDFFSNTNIQTYIQTKRSFIYIDKAYLLVQAKCVRCVQAE